MFFGTVAYTIYRKTRRGWYDENNNEISDPSKREENAFKATQPKYEVHDEDEEDETVSSSLDFGKVKSSYAFSHL